MSSRTRVLLCMCCVAMPLIVVQSIGMAAELREVTELYRTGKYAKCVTAAENELAKHEFNENFRLLKLRAEMELGRYADAAVTLDAALKKFGNSIELRWLGREVCRFNNQPERAAKLDEEIAQLVKQTPWQYSDSANRIVLGRFLLNQGADPKKVLDATFNYAKKQQPTFVPAFLASGQLALEKHDFALAALAFEQAVKLDPADADAHFGLAQAFAPSEPEKADAAIKAALERNPNHVGCLLLIADEHIDSERYDDADTVLTQVELINPLHPAIAQVVATTVKRWGFDPRFF